MFHCPCSQKSFDNFTRHHRTKKHGNWITEQKLINKIFEPGAQITDMKQIIDKCNDMSLEILISEIDNINIEK